MRAPGRAVELYIRPRLLARDIEHIAGPERIDYGPEEVLAICVVRNGALHVRSFVEHHLRLGVRHIVFLDNGSADDTVDIARGYSSVTVLRTAAPYQRYENVMKRYLAERFSAGRWNLCVDIDERFDYPHSNALSLSGFLAYLNQRSFTAVVAQMLDLFPDGELGRPGEAGGIPLREAHCFYDLSAIRATEYRYGVSSNPAIRMHWGGIRKAAFGTDNGLTKAPLVRVGRAADMFVHWHHVASARLADVSAVLLHYPFAGEFAAKVQDAVQTGRYGKTTTREYERYWRGLQGGGGVRLKGPDARRLRDIGQLVSDGFLATSAEYERWVAVHALPSTAE